MSLLLDYFKADNHDLYVTHSLTKELHLDIPRLAIAECLERHPNPGTLLAISETLSFFSIESLPINTKSEDLGALPVPFLSLVDITGNGKFEYTIVRSVDENVSFLHPVKRRWVSVESKYFRKISSNNFLLVDASEYVENRSLKFLHLISIKRRYFFAISSALSLFLSYLYLLSSLNEGGILYLLYCISIVFGLFVSALLIVQEVDDYKSRLSKICTIGKKLNCKKILQSEGSRIGGISWIDIGSSYFLGCFFFSLTSLITYSLNYLFILWFLSISAVPFIFYSIYYQWRIVKSWCIYCVAIQVVLFSMASVSTYAKWFMIGLNTSIIDGFVRLSLSFCLSFVIITAISYLMRKEVEGKSSTIDLARLKRNKYIFKSLLEKEKYIDGRLESQGLMLKSQEGRDKLTCVCSLFCGPCGFAMPTVAEIAAIYNDTLDIEFVFTSSRQEDPYRMKLLSAMVDRLHLLSNDRDAFFLLLNQWHKNGVTDSFNFAKTNNLESCSEDSQVRVHSMRTWCESMKIVSTPTFIFNGFYLPEIYKIDDLIYLISKE